MKLFLLHCEINVFSSELYFYQRLELVNKHRQLPSNFYFWLSNRYYLTEVEKHWWEGSTSDVKECLQLRSEIWSFLLCVFQCFLSLELCEAQKNPLAVECCNADAYESALGFCAVQSCGKKLLVKSARAELVINGSCNLSRTVGDITTAW